MTLTPLQQARAVARPTREQMLSRDISIRHFWKQNRDLFENA